MHKISKRMVLPLVVFITGMASSRSAAQQVCFTSQERARAEQSAKVYRAPDPGYDPVLGYNPAMGPRRGAPPVNENGLAKAINCVANKDEKPGAGTTPKFHCSVAGNTGDEGVADVNCPTCEKSLTKSFQGASFSPFQPAAGIELPLARGIDVNCNNKDSAPLGETLTNLLKSGAPRAEIDAFKLWLAFIDHGDTKADNHKFACLSSKKNGNTRMCEPGEAVFYVGDMGSTFGFSTSSEKKARLDTWRHKKPIEVKGGACMATAKSIGDTSISEGGRKLLADNLQRLLDAEQQNQTITRVFAASRNAERDRPPAEWTAEVVRKAKLIIDARCSN